MPSSGGIISGRVVSVKRWPLRRPGTLSTCPAASAVSAGDTTDTPSVYISTSKAVLAGGAVFVVGPMKQSGWRPAADGPQAPLRLHIEESDGHLPSL